MNRMVCEGILISEGLSAKIMSVLHLEKMCVFARVWVCACHTARMWNNFDEWTLFLHRVDPGDGIELRSSGLAASATTTEPFCCCSVYLTAHQCFSFFQRTQV